jgi:hypothetical protein
MPGPGEVAFLTLPVGVTVAAEELLVLFGQVFLNHSKKASGSKSS